MNGSFRAQMLSALHRSNHLEAWLPFHFIAHAAGFLTHCATRHSQPDIKPTPFAIPRWVARFCSTSIGGIHGYRLAPYNGGAPWRFHASPIHGFRCVCISRLDQSRGLSISSSSAVIAFSAVVSMGSTGRRMALAVSNIHCPTLRISSEVALRPS